MSSLENTLIAWKLLRAARSRARTMELNPVGSLPLSASGALSAARIGKFEVLERAHFQAPEAIPEARAYWMNLYNTLTLHSLHMTGVKGSVLDVPDFFSKYGYLVSGQLFCLHDIEHGVLRGNKPVPFGKPAFAPNDARVAFSLPLDTRIHFALNCGAASCPPIRAFDAAHLETQLELAAQSYLHGARLEAGIVWLPRLLSYYPQDFGQPLEYARHYRPDLPEQARVRFDPYSWKLG